MTARILRHLLRPARGGAMLIIIVFSILLLLCGYAGLLGVPLALILVSWYFKYAYILFDAVSRGFDDPPALDIQAVNPANGQRPLGQVVILGAIFGAATLAQMYVSRSFAIGIIGISLFLLPASAAVLGVEGHLLKALYPIAWFKMVEGMGALYAVVLATILVYTGIAMLLAHSHVWQLVALMYAMFALLSLFSLLGGIVYERRDELGLEAWISPERTAAKAQTQRAKDDAHWLAHVYGKCRASHHVEAWNLLTEWLAARGNTLEDYRWLMPRVALWDDPRYATRVTQEFLERLLALKQGGEALKVAAARLAIDPAFRPRTAAATMILAQLAAQAGGTRSVARAFASDFDARFPSDPSVAAVTALRARLLS